MSARRFDTEVPAGGYRWWYIDANSDDGRYGLVIIAFIGSVFSPYYARARRREPTADPHAHCAVNVALYGDNRRWTMTERGPQALQRDAQHLRIGPSHLHWEGDALVIDLDEIGAPLPRRVCGQVRLFAPTLRADSFALDSDGHHRWQPIAPCARIEVRLDVPAMHWLGDAYCDSNSGDLPLEHSFSHWHWSRCTLRGGDTAVLYDVSGRDGARTALALHFDADGAQRRFDAPPECTLPGTRWGIARSTRCERGAPPQVRTLEDTPFYARSLLHTQLLGEPVRGVHESLDLTRFSSGWVQMLLPFRMPRRAHWHG
ncbi:carotenoid 1,2-hydratase [Methyloversatilis thermotolerans]|uniref:carotenoid 1,2-hydratase n=1 Tax=Methyloversatilis thermotolerans TaxID=1346290 RepID=UPI000379904F|nr:carotenoid 1,2-hydratase [Methyloversatilis thermotolerans]